jgi:hypothetical protein
MPRVPKPEPFGITNGKSSSISSSPLLIPLDFLQELRESGITDYALIRECGVYFESDARKLAKVLNYSTAPEWLLNGGGGLVYPFFDADGKPDGLGTVKLRNPRLDKKGKKQKYEAPLGGQRAWIPPPTRRMLNDPNTPIDFTEGCKKAMALLGIGRCAISVNGIWGWKVKDEERLAEDLLSVDWRHRIEYISFDNDGEGDADADKKRRDMRSSVSRFARLLTAEGAAAVYRVDLPPGSDGGKCGVDDFLLSHDGEGFLQLVRQAQRIDIGNSIIEIIPFEPPILGEAAFHGPAGKFLRTVDPHTEAASAGILAHLLPLVGVLVGPGVYIPTGCDKQYARINTLLVGTTSHGRKGTAAGVIHALMMIVDRKLWEGGLHGSGLSTGEGLIHRVADLDELLGRNEVPETAAKPIQKVIAATPSDFNTGGLTAKLAATAEPEQPKRKPYRDKRLLVIEEEFSRVTTVKGRDGNTLSQAIRTVFDRGYLEKITSTSSERAANTHISIIGHTTPEEMKECLGTLDLLNGFVNRFLIFGVSASKTIALPKPTPDEVFTDFANRLRALAQVGRRDEDGHYKSIPVAMTSEAEELWEEVATHRFSKEAGLIGSILARARPIVLRLSLIYALLDWEIQPVALEGGAVAHEVIGHPVVDTIHIEAALAVWDYCEESARRLFAGGKPRSLVGIEGKIVQVLRDHGALTKDAFNDHLSPKQKEQFPDGIARLLEKGIVRETKLRSGKRGAPPTLYELV